MRVLTELRVKRTNQGTYQGQVSNIRFELAENHPGLAKNYPELTGKTVTVWFNLSKEPGEWKARYLETVTGHWSLGDN